jgi:hypothetical protein
VNALPLGFGRMAAALVLAMLFFASVAVLATAEPSDAGPIPAADARRDAADAATVRGRVQLDDAQRNLVPIAIELSGIGVDADGNTYDVNASGKGLAKTFFRQGHLAGVFGYARMDADITDANGSIVKETGGFAVKFVAHRTADRSWHWSMESRASDAYGGNPKLSLAGKSGGPDNGTLPIEGKGYAIILPDGADQRLTLRLEVAGVVERQARDRPSADRAPVVLNLTGTASGRDNQNLSLAIVGKGLVHAKAHDGNASAFRGVLHVMVTVSDGDTRIQTVRFPVTMSGSQDANGTWHWRLGSVDETRTHGPARLALRGTGTGTDNGTLALDGAGWALVRSDGGPMRVLLAVDGTLARA